MESKTPEYVIMLGARLDGLHGNNRADTEFAQVDRILETRGLALQKTKDSSDLTPIFTLVSKNGGPADPKAAREAVTALNAENLRSVVKTAGLKRTV